MRVRPVLASIAPLRRAARRAREVLQSDPLVTSLYQKVFERGRLKLPTIVPETFITDGIGVELPVLHPLFAGEDTPLVDLLFILAVAKSRSPKRLLEVGTYRAKTTLALFRNCPGGHIISYDVTTYVSKYRDHLVHCKNVELRRAAFAESGMVLLREPKFDLIYIDGAHDVKSVCEDSALAFKILTPDGLIIWHDYRYNGYATEQLRVPEALELVKGPRQLFHVSSTTCAVYCPSLPAG